MSGHSKWSTIKNKKAATDAKRGKIFTKIGRELAVAVKEGGPNPENNNKLRDCIAKARANNMPNDNIMRSIKKAAGEIGSINYETVIYEGYGVAGVAVIVDALTDNRNRTASDVRHAFDKSGGSLGATGCVSWMFERRGEIAIERSGGIDEDELMMTALDAGALDVSSDDEMFEVVTDPDNFSAVREALEKSGLELASAELSMAPQNYVNAGGQADQIRRLLDLLEDLDDVQNVYHNCADLPDEE